jgi:hypothetical protein
MPERTVRALDQTTGLLTEYAGRRTCMAKNAR